MNTTDQIDKYIQSLPESRRLEMHVLHQRIQKLLPKSKGWFLDGKDDKGKVVTNPNIGYGLLTMQYANGKTREFYQIGISANTTGISVYIMGIDDKDYLPKTYGKKLGKSIVTGYCIKFKKTADINLKVLDEAILDGVARTK